MLWHLRDLLVKCIQSGHLVAERAEFVDSPSPLSALFIVGSLILFAGTLIYSVEEARQPEQSASTGLAD
ncbi:hypothetical protein C5B91_18530 [Haloferax sp. Atlit-10N]|nr:hypothetical protein C5B87_10025 [Haloferax sp. Atlit-16N]RDZ56338.1 hypothetical protein C5B91_18530 [Haloferax sp. Atlit-10N]